MGGRSRPLSAFARLMTAGASPSGADALATGSGFSFGGGARGLVPRSGASRLFSRPVTAGPGRAGSTAGHECVDYAPRKRPGISALARITLPTMPEDMGLGTMKICSSAPA